MITNKDGKSLPLRYCAPCRTNPIDRQSPRLARCSAAATSAAVTPAGRWTCGATPETAPSPVEGRVLILPGVGNTRFHLAGFVAAAEAQLPRFDVEVRTWGKPFLTIHNLRAHERNVATAAEHRRGDRRLAPRASRRAVLPRRLFRRRRNGDARDFGAARRRHASIASCSSRPRSRPTTRSRARCCRTCASSSSTTRASAICKSGGARARSARSTARTPRAPARSASRPTTSGCCEYHWSAADVPFGHAGNHLAYLNGRWQAAKLLPALDPARGPEALRAPLGAHLQGVLTWPWSSLRCSAASSAARCSATSAASCSGWSSARSSGWVADLAGRVRTLERRLEARKAADARRAGRATRAARCSGRTARRRRRTAGRCDRSSRRRWISARSGGEPRAAADRRVAPAAASRRRTGSRRARAARGARCDSSSRRFRQVARESRGAGSRPATCPSKSASCCRCSASGFLVKEGIDRQWLVLPLELRLMFVALFGIGLLVLGWRLRTRQRTYALRVQGGGIGVLYLTIYASFGLYDLLPAAARVRACSSASRPRPACSPCCRTRARSPCSASLGGFLAPVLVSTGSGNHVALFGYYALLERRDRRHRVVQGVARAERARLRVHVRHRHALGHRRVHAGASSRRPSRSSCCSR